MGCNLRLFTLGGVLTVLSFYDYLYFYWHSGVGIVRLFIAGPAKNFRSRVYKISSNYDAPLDPDFRHGGVAMG